MSSEKKSNLFANKFLFLGIFMFVIFGMIKIIFFENIWFDSSFSLEFIASRNIFQMFLNPVDVHPPLYYVALDIWQSTLFVGKGIIEIQYARFLSLIFGVIFLVYLNKVVKKLFDDERFANFVVYTFAFFSVYINIFTEIRMYAMALMLTMIAFWHLLNAEKPNIMQDKHSWWFFIFSFLALWTHYYTCFFLGMAFLYILYFKEKAFWMKLLGDFFSWGAVLWVPLFTYFLIQFMKIEGMWFKGVTFMSFFSSLYYAFFHSNVNLMGDYESVIGLIFVFATLIFSILYYIGLRDLKEKRIILFLLIMGMLPQLIGLIINNFYNVYHHRFFIFTYWAYAVVVLRMLFNNKWKYKLLIGLIFFTFFVFKFFTFYSTIMTELDTMGDYVNDVYCYKDIYVLHESPFTSVTGQLYDRLGNCFYNTLLFSDLTKEQFASAGGAVIPMDTVINNTIYLEDYHELLYYQTEGNDLLNWTEVNWIKIILLDLEGIDLVFAYQID